MNSVKTQFGKHLRKLRLAQKLTQEELADRSGLHPTYVGQMERGLRNPSLVNLYRLAKALNISAGKLLPF